MACMRRRFAHPFGGSLILSLGLHVALVAFVLAAGWHRIPSVPTVLQVSLLAPPPGEPGISTDRTPGGSLALAAPDAAGKALPAPRPAAKVLKKALPPLVKRRPERLAHQPPSQAMAETKAVPRQPDILPAPGSMALPERSAPPDAENRAAAGGVGVAGGLRATGSSTGSGRGSGQDRSGRGDGGGGSQGLAAVQVQYLGLVRARILAHRQYPPLARARHMEGVVRLRFTLSHTGALSRGVQIVKTSGFSLLDEQASRCVLAAAPFPPFPSELQKQSLIVEVPIVYQLKDWSS